MRWNAPQPATVSPSIALPTLHPGRVNKGETTIMGLEFGLLGLILLVLVIYAIIKTVGSSASTGTKVIWVVVLVVFPFVGFIAWLIFGPRS